MTELNYKKITCGLIISLVVFFSTYKLTESPPIWYDEGLIIQPAINLARLGKMALQVAPNELISLHSISVGFPLFYPLAVIFKYFGVTLLGARILMTFFLIALVCLFFALGNKLFSFKRASYAALLLVTFAPLYGNGKNVLGEVPGLLFLFLFFYFLSRIEKDFNNKANYAIAGIFAGLCVVTKPLFLLLLPALAVAVFLLRKRLVFKWNYILLAMAVFLLPVIFWIKTQFWSSDAFLSVFSYYSNPYGEQNILAIIGSNFLRFFKEFSPAYFFILFLIWVSAIILRYKKKEYFSLIEVMGFVFSLLILIAFLRTAGWYRYFFVANIITFLFIPSSIFVLYDFIKEKNKIINKFKITPLAIVLLIAIFQFYQLCFNSWVADYYSSHGTQVLNDYFKEFKKEQSVFIYDSPEVVIFLPHQNYFQYIAITDFIHLGEEQLVKIKKGVPDLVVIKKTAIPTAGALFTDYAIKGNIGRYSIYEKLINNL